MKCSFENIHRNKKMAFIDGLLCGLAIWMMTSLCKRDFDEPFLPWMKRIKKDLTV